MNELAQPRRITHHLADFLRIPRDQSISRADVNMAITAYIYFKPLRDNDKNIDTVQYRKKLYWADRLNPSLAEADGKRRYLRDLKDPKNPTVIIPDERLSELLEYDKFVEDVHAGKITFKCKNAKTEKQENVVHTDTHLTYPILQHLLTKHFLEDIPKKEVWIGIYTCDEDRKLMAVCGSTMDHVIQRLVNLVWEYKETGVGDKAWKELASHHRIKIASIGVRLQIFKDEYV